ncbi:MMPL family transporter [Leifsonia sp. H3M29-4]|uniref:MMPL family transporter n=1 Tax=Salinibacterium metalliresistens TaxID=3031321 RepID=UPI0023DB971F|nr:MMPL family transporter [Salinibacterium metalliresistens]MDF1478183.1 MMPL family transporter [Salinibacterium metalliresistens]
MTPTEPTGALAATSRLAARHPFVTIAAWAVVLAVSILTALSGIGGESLFDRLDSAAPTARGESTDADDLLAGTGEQAQSLSLALVGVDPTDATAIAITADLADRVAALDHTELLDPLAAPRLPDGSPLPALAPLFAEDGDGFLITGTVTGVDGGAPDEDERDALQTELEATATQLREEFPNATAEVGGTSLLVSSIIAISEQDLRRGESVALPIALLVMLVVFGGFLAAGIPLVGAVVSIVGGLGVLFGFTFVTDIDTTVVNVVTAVGLGLSIDYGLLMVSRFREEYRAELGASSPSVHREHLIEAIARTAASAGRTVTYSGITFAIASLSLLAFEPRLMRAVGLGALAVTALAIASAITLVPALLALAGPRLARPGALTRIPGLGRVLSRFGDVAPAEGFFSRLTRRVQRHPALITIACAAVLVLLGSPLASLRLANTSVDALPQSSTQYAFVDTLREHFPQAASPRVALVTETEADAVAWAEQVQSLPAVQSVAPPVAAGDGWRVNVRVDPADGIPLVERIRAERPDFPAWVTGTDARTLDLSQALLRGVPLAVLIVALGTFVLLFLMTGSVVIPIKALIASALSLGASIGVLVWGFEQGNFAGMMGFNAADVHGVDVLVLVLTFAFGFGLAMDYELFILSRVKELKDAGASDEEAIALGLQRSGRIISSAALIIIVVFAGFATGDLMVIKQLGTALAVAVLLDATLVRCLLVPALMTWQRRIMWWSPRWMKRLHARFALTD